MENSINMKKLENELYEKACKIKLNAKNPQALETVDKILRVGVDAVSRLR